MNYEKKILNLLIDKYEKRKGFAEDKPLHRKVYLDVLKAFPAYGDHANYEAFSDINEAVKLLEGEMFIEVTRKGSVLQKLALNVVHMDAMYAYLRRKPKSLRISQLREVLLRYQDKNPILKAYCVDQFERLDFNQSVMWLGEGTVSELEQLLLATTEALKIEDETYIRDFSVKVFGDSKTFEKLSDKMTALLDTYGDFSERSRILEELNLVKNPTYVHLKGAIKLSIGGQELDLRGLSGDLALSSALLADIGRLELTSGQVMTVENLTSYHTQPCEDSLIIYLGGFHNQVRRTFLKKLYEQNPQAIYLHFGDIDAGGFYILEHLKQMTGIPFEAYRMDVQTLKQYQAYAKPLTATDEKRLSKFIDGPYSEVITYMLENHCKLEQEAVKCGHIL